MNTEKLFSFRRRAKRQVFYSKRAWKWKRSVQLRLHPRCEHCKKSGRQTEATVCDHIDPTWETWDEFINGRVQSLCEQCHGDKTRYEDMPKLIKAEKLRVEVWK